MSASRRSFTRSRAAQKVREKLEAHCTLLGKGGCKWGNSTDVYEGLKDND